MIHRTRREIASDAIAVETIQPSPHGWRVPSESGDGFYLVNLNDEDRRSSGDEDRYSRRPDCTCADHQYRHARCKHIAAVFRKLAAFEITMGEIAATLEVAREWMER